MKGKNKGIDPGRNKPEKKQNKNEQKPESPIPEGYTPEERAEIYDRENVEGIIDYTTKSLGVIRKESPVRTVYREMKKEGYKEKPQGHIENRRNKLITKIDDMVKKIRQMYPKKRISFDLVKKFTDVLVHHEQNFVSFSDEYNKIALALLYDLEAVNNIDLNPLKMEFAKFSTQNIEDDQQELFVDILLTEVEMTGSKILKKLVSGELMNIDAA